MTTAIATDLGHVARPAASPYDDVRLALLDAVIAANASGAPDQQARWEAAFAAAAATLRDRVLTGAAEELRDAALRSRYPARTLRARLPGAAAADALLNRLLADGMPLERFEGAPNDDTTRRARAAALDASWEAAVRTARAQTASWRRVAAEIEAWRRPAAPIWIVSVLIVGVALVIALWLGGELRAPAWFAPINEWWWSLWP